MMLMWSLMASIIVIMRKLDKFERIVEEGDDNNHLMGHLTTFSFTEQRLSPPKI